MKIFKGKSTEFYCGHCKTWISLQKLLRVQKHLQPRTFTDGKSTKDFKRIYECPKCSGIVLRSK